MDGVSSDSLTEMDNSGSGPLRVPGFGLPISFEYTNWLQMTQTFELAAAGSYAERMTKREVAMVIFMEAITDKTNWNLKIHDTEIVAKWREEARSFPDQIISDLAFQWCIEELRDRAKSFEANGSSWVSALESSARVAKADNAITAEARDELCRAVQPLLDAEPKDWHPGSDNKVLNLVHPSLYSLVYGRTPVLTEGGIVDLNNCIEFCGKGTPGKPDQFVKKLHPHYIYNHRLQNASLWSQKFQWLPAEVKFTNDKGSDVKITSYINNLYPPEHQKLYGIIENIIGQAIPIWNHVLLRGNSGGVPLRIRVNEAEFDISEPTWILGNFADSPELRQNIKEYLTLPDSSKPISNHFLHENLPENWETTEDELNSDMLYEVVRNKYERLRTVIHPEPGNYSKWRASNSIVNAPNGRKTNDANLAHDYRKKGLQIIVKLSSIELTPEKPSFDGGSWHLEGMLNERIIGTAIYYFDVANITHPRLHFRQEATIENMDLKYEHGDQAPLAEIFGVESFEISGEPGVQEIGAVATKEGRMLVFPNTLQHKLDPFELIDKEKPGHRRVLVIWLVDPEYRVVSTSNVPPQQKDLYLKGLEKTDPEGNLHSQLANTANRDTADGLMDLEEAKRFRMELMDERMVFLEVF
jgi:hypothetical protein